MPMINEKFEEVTEVQEQQIREKLKNKWTQLEAIVGTDNLFYGTSAGGNYYAFSSSPKFYNVYENFNSFDEYMDTSYRNVR